MTSRETTTQQVDKKVGGAGAEEGKVSSDEDEIEPPRSQSLPTMKWVEPPVQDIEDDELLSPSGN